MGGSQTIPDIPKEQSIIIPEDADIDSAYYILKPNERTDAMNVIFEEGSLIEEIPQYMFSKFVLLKNIQLPPQLKKINTASFLNCTDLKTIKLPPNLTHIYSFAFTLSGLETIALPDNLEYIGESSFFNCKHLKQIDVPHSLRNIGRDPFLGCNMLTKIVLKMTDVSFNIMEKAEMVVYKMLFESKVTETVTNTLTLIKQLSTIIIKYNNSICVLTKGPTKIDYSWPGKTTSQFIVKQIPQLRPHIALQNNITEMNSTCIIFKKPNNKQFIDYINKAWYDVT